MFGGGANAAQSQCEPSPPPIDRTPHDSPVDKPLVHLVDPVFRGEPRYDFVGPNQGGEPPGAAQLAPRQELLPLVNVGLRGRLVAEQPAQLRGDPERMREQVRGQATAHRLECAQRVGRPFTGTALDRHE